MLGYLVIVLFAASVLAYVFWPAFRARINGYKTIATSAFIAALGVLQASDLTQIVDAKTAGLWLLGIGILMAVLRVISSGPAGGIR
jgi:hypothetical protein